MLGLVAKLLIVQTDVYFSKIRSAHWSPPGTLASCGKDSVPMGFFWPRQTVRLKHFGANITNLTWAKMQLTGSGEAWMSV